MWSVFIHEPDDIVQLGPYKTRTDAEDHYAEFEEKRQRYSAVAFIVDENHKAWRL